MDPEDIVWQDDHVITTHEKVYFSLTRVAGFVSVLSAVCILVETVGDVRAGAATTVTRLLLAMQVGQICHSSMWAVGNWAAPSFIPDAWSAQGTIWTCELAGFLLNLGALVVILYDAALSITYLLMLTVALASMVLSVFCMLSIVLFVRNTEARNARYLERFYRNAQSRPPRQSDVSTTSHGPTSSVRSNTEDRFYKTRMMAFRGVRYASTNLLASTPIFLQVAFDIDSQVFLDVAACSYALHGFYYLVFFLRDRKVVRSRYGRLWKRLLYVPITYNGGHADACRCCCCCRYITRRRNQQQCSTCQKEQDKLPATTNQQPLERNSANSAGARDSITPVENNDARPLRNDDATVETHAKQNSSSI
ncbi:expressed unknown protein [Seminavis robusta]|uniref:Uncharacterized protein n=1 Tax=Seminavis robusta TaxID=568900 RepID=A0A9N8ESE2_9STRA|nr:expressed unknown protein [Seminavis robusta]|eukprot:Sro1463_g274840.1 n/a (364) ;mRNA; f:21698-23010